MSEIEQLEEEEQDLQWILSVVQRIYIEEQSNARMYDVLFANEIKKCIPSGFTEQILRHENNAIEPTENVEPTCNISSDDESEDENGSRDGDDGWLLDDEDDLHDQAAEWEAWVQSLGMASTTANDVSGFGVPPASTLPNISAGLVQKKKHSNTGGDQGILDEFNAGGSESGLEPARGGVEVRTTDRGLSMPPANRISNISAGLV